MSSDTPLNALGEFLKARRAQLKPNTVGLPENGAQRRVAGLRREEVALLAGIRTDYYTRLEQGRIRPSPATLAALTRALHLRDDQRDHLFELAGDQAGRPRRRTGEKVQPHLRRLLDGLTTIPGMALGRSMDILAWNPLAAALLTDFAKVPEKERNYVRILFTDPAVKSVFADWETVARGCVAHLRTRAATYPADPRLAVLVGELSVWNPQFRQWWGAHHVTTRTTGTTAFNHPVAGTLALAWDILTCGADADQELLVWTAEPGTPSDDGLRILSSWNTTPTGR